MSDITWTGRETVGEIVAQLSGDGDILPMLEAIEAKHNLIVEERRTIKRLSHKLRKLRREMDGIKFAAHMPGDWFYGLPSWINQRLYAGYLWFEDFKHGTVSREQDVEEIVRSHRRISELERFSAQIQADLSAEWQANTDLRLKVESLEAEIKSLKHPTMAYHDVEQFYKDEVEA